MSFARMRAKTGIGLAIRNRECMGLTGLTPLSSVAVSELVPVHAIDRSPALAIID